MCFFLPKMFVHLHGSEHKMSHTPLSDKKSREEFIAAAVCCRSSQGSKVQIYIDISREKRVFHSHRKYSQSYEKLGGCKLRWSKLKQEYKRSDEFISQSDSVLMNENEFQCPVTRVTIVNKSQSHTASV